MNNQDRELLHAFKSEIKAEIKANFDLVGYKLDEVIKHQKETNGRVNRLENETQMTRWIQANPKWSIPAAILLFLLIALIVVNIPVCELTDRIRLW